MKYESRCTNSKIINSTKLPCSVINFHIYSRHIFTITISFRFIKHTLTSWWSRLPKNICVSIKKITGMSNYTALERHY